jgi:hypothetical protein
MGALHCATDCWTSPNNRAFIALTVHYEADGQIEGCVLDVRELPRRHTGKRLAAAFTEVLSDFDIEEKVSNIADTAPDITHILHSFVSAPATMHQQTT